MIGASFSEFSVDGCIRFPRVLMLVCDFCVEYVD